MTTTLKRILGIAIFVTLISGTAFAQSNRRTGPPKPPSKEQQQRMINGLSHQLSLTESQKKQVTVLFAQHFEEMQTAMKSQQRPGKKAMDAKRDAFHQQIKTVLNPTQQKKFEEFLKNHRPPQGRQQQGQNRNGGRK